MHLFSTNGREPLQKLVNGRASVEVLEQRGDREPSASEAPYPAELAWVPADGAHLAQKTGFLSLPALGVNFHFP